VHYPSTLTDGGLEASVVGLHLRLGDVHFDRKGKMKLTCTASVGRMRIDGHTVVNISIADVPINGDYPKQRSLTLDSRSGVNAGNYLTYLIIIWFVKPPRSKIEDSTALIIISNVRLFVCFFSFIGISQTMTFWNWRFCPAILLVVTLLCQTFG
jgi:hypothetical protein